MALADQPRETDPEAETGEPWDFPTLTPENFSGSPQRRKQPQDPLAVQLSLAEAFKNYDQVLLFLEQDGRLESILRKLAFHELLSDRQRHEFSLPDPDKRNPGRFLRFLTAADASALLAGVVILMGADPVGRLLLRLDDPRVQTLLKQSKGFDRPVNSPKSPYTDFYEITRVQLLRSPPPPLRFSPAPTQPMVLRSPPSTPTPAYFAQLTSPEEPLSPSSLKGEMHDIPELPIHNIPDEASEEQQFPFSVIRDIELSGARVILTRTHTLYRDSSSRCFVAFNIVFQPRQDRFRTAEISMTFLPIAGIKQHPVILNIFPNPNQRWSTGPSCDLVSNARKNINLMVGTATPVAANVSANLGLEKSTEIKSASNSSLTAAGVATSKLTISLSESRAGDGIIYSFAFAVVLDLRTQSKPDFSANLRINWQLGNRSWFPRHRFSISEEVAFSKQTELDGGDSPSISSRHMDG
ncbi:hypothetical protein PGT21_027846 [Puccinia graminis f. sp. tritici]|uniref:Uncharacterized protein n=1 Tax=Puccinia graminis f. sp. tritici TaxID=56615 RepID=A0A5B0MLW0_PUCGR|nr:hypothetical protein PGT21_027846 [Puccinia graminis f. sp. tritici]